MRKAINKDLLGQRFGRLVVFHKVPKDAAPKTGDTYWFTRCDCGSVKLCTTGHLNAGQVKSCGCTHGEWTSSERARSILSAARLRSEHSAIIHHRVSNMINKRMKARTNVSDIDRKLDYIPGIRGKKPF